MAQKLNQKQFGIKYTTNEQLTGDVWIDGKPIYRKTINFGALPNNTTKSVSHGISGLGYVIDVKAVGYRSSDGFRPVFPYTPSGDTVSWMYNLNINNTSIALAANADRTGILTYVTMEYTKA